MENFRKSVGAVLANALMTGFSLVSIYPFFWLLVNSFKTEREFSEDIFSFPKQWVFDNFIYVLREAKMELYAFNSFLNSVCSVAVVVLLSYIAGYFFSRFLFRFQKALYLFFMIGLFIPTVSLIVPMFMQFRLFNLLDKWYTLFPVYVAFGFPMAIFLIESFIGSIPIEIDEAATIDGCGLFRTMFHIILPLTAPVLSTVIILQFLNAWNEFPFALVLIKSDHLKTVALGLRNFSTQFTTNYVAMFAAMSVAMFPVMAVYAVFSKKIMVGMTSGSVKM